MDITTIAVLTNLALTAYGFHKIRKIHQASYRIEKSSAHADQEVTRLYGQIQAYHDLISTIQPRKPLPALRGWAASPDFLLHAANHVLTKKPRTIVECSSGASTIVLARCCEINGFGYVSSLEHDSRYAERTRQDLKEQKLERWATVIDAPLQAYPQIEDQRWYSINTPIFPESKIDLLVVDGPPLDSAALARYPALLILQPNLSSDCTILLDDADREEEAATLAMWHSEFPEFTQYSLPAEKGCAKLERTSC